MPNSQPLVSIVTPVYNGDKYIVECIESVLSQTYENWEYIVLDNCSTDKTAEIVRDYMQRDDRIKLYANNELLKIIDNWNRAMGFISPQSKYCKTVHSDDWLFPECIERMVALAEKYPSVGIVGSYRLDEDLVNLDGLPYPSSSTPGRKICEQFFRKENYLFGSPTSTLIATSEIFKRKPFYNADNLHADIEICLDILRERDFGFVHQVLTFTRRHNESTTSFSKLYGTQLISQLFVTNAYGKELFAEKEYRSIYKAILDKYYRFMGKRMCEFREFKSLKDKRKLYQFHVKELKKNGISFNWALLLRSVIYYQFNRVLYKLTF